MIWIVFILLALLIAALFFAFVSPLGDGGVYMPSPVVDELIQQTNLIAEGDVKLFGGGSLERRGELYVLRLSGTPYEMGFQHGCLLREEVHQGALLFYDRAVDTISPFKQMSSPLRWFLKRYFDWFIFRPLMKNSPDEYMQELKGLADGCGLPFERVLRGNMFSELSMNLGGLLASTFARQLKTAECTSFAAYGQMTTNGDLIVGRNTDYWGLGLWDKYHVVMFYQPAEGHSFVNVSSAGLLKCNSCMNEKGLVLGGHFLFSDDVSPRGISFTAFELEIMKKAASIEEAYRIVAGTPRAGAFAYLVADGGRKEAAVIEACASMVGLRWGQGERVWETNYGTTPEFAPYDLLLRFGVSKNSLSRYERMRVLLEENRGQIDAQKAAFFMGDHLDMCSGDERPSGHVIGTLNNMTSVVFNPTRFDFWVAVGTSPVANNIFLGFNLLDELKGVTHPIDPPRLAPNPYAESQSFVALRRYYEAAQALTVPPTDLERAHEIVEELSEEFPDQAGFRLAAARMALQRGKTGLARQHLEGALDLRISPSERAQVHLLIGFCNDLEFLRERALEAYQQVLGMEEPGEGDILKSVNPFVLAEARRYCGKPFTASDAARLEISPEMSSRHDM